MATRSSSLADQARREHRSAHGWYRALLTKAANLRIKLDQAKAAGDPRAHELAGELALLNQQVDAASREQSSAKRVLRAVSR